MPEYIDREAAKAACGCENAVKYGNETPGQRSKSYSTLMLYEVADAIDDVPAADVAPVRHGEWVEQPNGDYTCSKCGRVCADDHVECPYCHCGARMDAKEDAHD